MEPGVEDQGKTSRAGREVGSKDYDATEVRRSNGINQPNPCSQHPRPKSRQEQIAVNSWRISNVDVRPNWSLWNRRRQR
jgi:hypothetical protein